MKNIILSVGGGLIYTDTGINTPFLKEFNRFVRKKIAEDKSRRFFIMAGGGSVSRKYQKAAELIDPNISNYDLDWIGVRSTRLNAHLLRTIFGDIARPTIVEHYDVSPLLTNERVVICAGWYPGSSTDWALVLLAKTFESSVIYSLMNVLMVYREDPNRNPNAQPITTLTWGEYRRMVGDSWDPKMQVPFDPIAAKLAQSLNIKAVLTDGKNLDNFNKALNNKKFIGTTITVDIDQREQI